MESPSSSSPRSVVTRSPDRVAAVRDHAIIGLDPEGRVESWNLGAETLTGYSAAEVLGHHHSVFYPEEAVRSGLPGRLFVTALAAGRVEDLGWCRRRDGCAFWADVVITALHDRDGSHVGFTTVIRDLTEQHRLQESLRASEERFRTLVSQVRDHAIIALDPRGFVESWNAGAEAVKGYAAHEVIGRHFSIFHTDADRATALPERLLDRAVREGRVEDRGWRVRRDGTRFWGEVVLTAIRDDDGLHTGFTKVTRDATDRHRLDQAQDFFLAGLGHDLRTSLTAIAGFAELVGTAPDEARDDIVDRILANTDRLSALVDDLVESARLRAGAVRLNLEPLELGAEVERRVRELGTVLAGHHVQVSGDEVSVSADRAALARVLDNLLANAARYSPPGSTITVTTRRTIGGGEVVVADEGRGVLPDDLPLVFEDFYRGDLAYEDTGETGIGLADVRRLVELHEGRVDMESEPGVGTRVGTRVTVVLPTD